MKKETDDIAGSDERHTLFGFSPFSEKKINVIAWPPLHDRPPEHTLSYLFEVFRWKRIIKCNRKTKGGSELLNCDARTN